MLQGSMGSVATSTSFAIHEERENKQLYHTVGFTTMRTDPVKETTKANRSSPRYSKPGRKHHTQNKLGPRNHKRPDQQHPYRNEKAEQPADFHQSMLQNRELPAGRVTEADKVLRIQC
jgi:hypothetical protein